MAGPFTTEMLHALLCKVLKVGNRPAKTDPAIARLSGALNILYSEVQLWTKPWRELEEIDEAIRALIEQLVAHLCSYRNPANDHLRLGWAHTLLDALRDAQDARRRHLPFSPGNEPRERLRDIKTELRRAFAAALPGASEEACYRFIREVVPKITGETPTVPAVKTEILQKR